jgi:polyhydroxybutyrate depolymerase
MTHRRFGSLRPPAFIAVAIALAVGLALQAAGSGAGAPQQDTIVHDGITRTYVVRLPDGPPRRNERLPLVIVLHGGGGNAANAEKMTGFTAKARKEGFVVVYPDGTSRLGVGLLTWNAGHCCGYAMENRVDDVGFIGALIDRMIAQHAVDPRRVYVSGMSNGAMMSHRLGIELSQKIAAIAPVVGAVFGDEKKPANPVSAIIINGALDKSVPPLGGPTGGRFAGAWEGPPPRPAVAQGAFWADADGCKSPPEIRDDPRATVARYACPGGRAVESYIVKGNGHAWPGGERGSRLGDQPTTSFAATDVIWDFFKAHVK